MVSKLWILCFCIVFANEYAVKAESNLPSTIVPSNYQGIKQLDPSLIFYWKINMTDTENPTIQVALSCQCTGWMAFGIGTNAAGGGSSMLHSDVCLGAVIGSNVTVADYNIDSGRFYGPGGLTPDQIATPTAGTDDILDFNGNTDGTTTEIIFTRKLDTGDPIDQKIISAPQTIIYGFSFSSTNTPFTQHNYQSGPFVPVSVSINLFSGAVTTSIDLRLVHGGLMFAAWACIVPWAAFVARFFKRFKVWFPTHWVSMSLAMITATTGFIIILTYSTQHFSDTHKIIGLIVMIFGICQPFIGTLADRLFNPSRTKTPIFPDKVHWFIGWGVMALALVNIALGINEYAIKTSTTYNGLLIAYCIIWSIITLFIIIYAVIKCISPGSKGGH